MQAITSDVLTAIACLAAIVFVIIMSSKVLQKMGYAQLKQSHRLGLQDVLSLDGVRRLYIVKCDQRELLLLTGSASEQVIAWLPSPEAKDAPEPGK